MTRYSNSKTSLAFLCLFCLLFLGCPSLVDAKEIGIQIAPNLIEIHPQENGIFTREILVENTGKDALDLDILLKPFVGDDEQNLHYPVEEAVSLGTKNFITNNVQVLENEQPITFLALGPKQKKKLTLKTTINDIQNISDYTFSLLFLSRSEIPQGSSTQTLSPLEARLALRIGTGVHILVAGEKETKQGNIFIQKFEAEKFIGHGPVSFKAVVKNTTSKYKKVYGNIIINNLFGQQVGVVRIPQQLILSGTTRDLKGSLEEATGSEKLVWNEVLLLGTYKARLELEAVDNAKLMEKTLSFSAFPLKPLTYAFFALIIISFLAQNIKKYI